MVQYFVVDNFSFALDKIHNLLSFLFEDSKTEALDIKQERRNITLAYGYYTFLITLFFLLVLPRWNRISNNLYYIALRLIRRLHLPNFGYSFMVINPLTLQMVVIWTIILTLLSLLQTRLDIKFIAARLGRVAVYCLPTVLFLTLRPSPLNQTLYLSLLPIHKWLSRLVVLQSLLHTWLYLHIFTKQDTMFKVYKLDNLNGVVAMVAFLIIAITSLPKVRRCCYNLFFINHYVCTWIATITLYFHVRPGIPLLTLLNCAILFYQIYYRFKVSKITTIEAHKISTNLTCVNLSNDSIINKSGLPGCHIRIIDFDEGNYLKILWKNFIAPIQHPFTLASLPIDNDQRLIVRNGNFKLVSNKKYLITGSFLPFLHFLEPFPYSNPKSLLFKTKVKKCLIIVGGSAISFALPILRVLSYNGAMIKIIWIIRDHEDLKVLDYFKNALVSDDCIDIFITGKYSDFEKKNFKDALSELHRRRRELELMEQDRMLGGDYSYSCMNTAANTRTDSHTSAKEGSSENSPHAIDSLNNALTPLKDTLHSNYGSLNLESNTLGHDLELGSPDNHRKSYIDLRTHHQQQSTGYSYAEENKFENVDIDLSRDGDYSRPNFSMISSAPQVNALGAGYSDTSYYDTQKDSLLNKFLLTSSSSGLYDDLEDYWILKGLSCRIEFGRPKLGLYYYSWCIGSSCIGPLVDLKSGESICYNQREDPGSGFHKAQSEEDDDEEEEDDLFRNATFLENRKVRFNERGGRPDDTTWVIGAGPVGLVDNVRLWASDCGFQFHEESFSV